MTRYFNGQGKLYIGGYPTPEYVPAGNCPSLVFSPTDLDYVRQMTNGLSQASDILPNIDVVMSLTTVIEELSAANLAVMLGGSLTTVAGGAGHTKVFLSKKGATFFLGEVVTSVQTLIGGGTWTQGTDYTANSCSISIPTTSAIPDGTSVTATFTAPTHLKLDPFQGGWAYKKFFFEGINVVDKKPYAIEFFKAKPQFLGGMALITDGIEGLQFTCVLLPDSNNAGKYYSMIQQE